MSTYALTITADTLEELDRYVHMPDAYAFIEDLRQKLRSISKYGEECTLEEFHDFFYETLKEYDIGHLI